MSDFPHPDLARVNYTETTSQNVVDCLTQSLGTMLLGDPGSEHINGIASVRKLSDVPPNDPASYGVLLETDDGARFKITVEKMA